MAPLDSNAPLDYALFQLTPTRTRCDLLVFSGGNSGERIASGLLEPFLSHLKSARDQIPKGGYSITLRTSSAGVAPWFTKSTLERFVRFVNTPDILERVDMIEREILQIESSIHLGNLAPSVASSLNGAHQIDQGCVKTENGNSKEPNAPSKVKVAFSSNDAAQGVNSKLCLQRALETRKIMLQKEQGMAYARASVTGFELARIGDLLSFADAFGASRLREACLNFKDLCMKKEKDKHWMDELAKLEAFSQQEFSYRRANAQLDPNCVAQDSLLGSANVSASPGEHQDGNLHMPRSQASVVPPNYQAQHLQDVKFPLDQPMSPYHGYPFPGMQFGSPYYPAHAGMQWPLHPEELSHRISLDADHYRRSSKPSRSKERTKIGKAQRSRRSTSMAQDGYSSDELPVSGSQSDADLDNDVSADRHSVKSEGLHMRRSKKNSRTVVIRNINYISSKRKDGSSDDSSADDALIDGDFLKEKVENVVDSIQKHHKSNRHKNKKNTESKNLGTDGTGEVCNNNVAISSVARTCDEGWKAFQNSLMRDEESAYNELEHRGKRAIIHGNTVQLVEGDEYGIIRSVEPTKESFLSCLVDAEFEKGMKQHLVKNDFVTTQRDVNIRNFGHMESFECDENYSKSMKTSQDLHEDLLCMSSAKPEGSDRDALSDFTNEPSALRSQRGGDCFIVSETDQLISEHAFIECSIFDGDRAIKSPHVQPHDAEQDEKKCLIDESFIVPTRPIINDQLASEWKTDISIVSGLMLAPVTHDNESKDKSSRKGASLPTCEPDDLQMVLERDSGLEVTVASWFPEVYCNAVGTSMNLSERKCEAEANNCEIKKVEANFEEEGKNKDISVKNKRDLKNKPLHGFPARSKSEALLRSRKPPAMSKAAVQKNKTMKEEEDRRRIEELVAERQKRIAQRSASSSMQKTSTHISTEAKVARGLVNHEKRSPPSAIQVKGSQIRSG